MTTAERPPSRKRPSADEPPSVMVRIPTALKGVVQELNKVYREAKQRRPKQVEKPNDETNEQ